MISVNVSGSERAVNARNDDNVFTRTAEITIVLHIQSADNDIKANEIDNAVAGVMRYLDKSVREQISEFNRLLHENEDKGNVVDIHG